MGIIDIEKQLLWLEVILVGVIAFLIFHVLFWIVKSILQRAKRQLDLLNKLRNPLSVLIMLASAYSCAHYVYQSLYIRWDQAFKIALIASICWLLINLVAVGRELITRQFDITAEDNLKARKVYTQIRVFERIAIVVIVVIGVALALMTFESIRNFGASLLASAGIAGVIVGVAAQKLIANLLAGFQIAVTQPIRIDDAVVIEGEWGRIEEITLTYVVLRIWDKRRLIIPASQVIEKPFQNWTRSSSEILGTVFIYVDYKLPVDPLRAELTSILENTPLWDGQVNVLQVTNLTERTMELRALMSAKDSPTTWDLRVHVREQLIKFLQKEYPHCLPKSRIELDQHNDLSAP
ncbi:MAG: mechanosensitive ion channel domain-containing protein [Bacteroidota bacterium]